MTTKSNTSPNRFNADVFVAVVFIAITQLDVWVFSLGQVTGIGTRIAASVLTVLASSALAWRRSRPHLGYWANSVGVIGTIAVGQPGDVYQWTNLIALYSTGAYGRGVQRWLALPAGMGGVLFYFARFPFEGNPLLTALVVAVWVVGWLAGRMYGARLDQVRLHHEMELSRRLADANEQRLVLEEERMRIARELHDIIGHTVNVMVVHAGAGRREIGGDVSLVRQAFDTIETTGRNALAELDRVLALLRRDESAGELAATPGLDDLEDLAAIFRDAGLAVEVEMSGDPESVPVSVGLSAYRIAQEALTNSMRHSGAGQAFLTARADDGVLELSIADDGTGEPSAVKPGRGITGMKERAAVHDGSVTLHTAARGGIEVRATLTWEVRP